MMKRMFFAMSLTGAVAAVALAYVEAPHTLGRCVHESTNIVLVQVERVNREKNLIIYKKVKDLKGNHPKDEIKHNIGQRGFHPREWQNIMKWAEEGKKAVFFYNGGASETCIDHYWYQCYQEGEWWGMTHAEPYLLRTFAGDPEKLAAAVSDILQGKEVVVSCMADGPKDHFHNRKGKMQQMKAGLKLLDYDPKRQFVAWGGEGADIQEFKTTVLLAESSAGWKFLPAAQAQAFGQRWVEPGFDDKVWRAGQSPIGYGEEEILRRKGTLIGEKGQAFLFRREFNLPGELLQQKGVIFRLAVASDDNAKVWLNGKVADQDPEPDHEFTYWNRDVELEAKWFVPGRNLVAVQVTNRPQSSDLFFDLEIAALAPLPKKLPLKKPADNE
ncbi:MAG: hypothetical protein L0215_09120 [Gemmataceae bacterium]|nr:hypothetical protein [Gemmataceae bacterium]